MTCIKIKIPGCVIQYQCGLSASHQTECDYYRADVAYPPYCLSHNSNSGGCSDIRARKAAKSKID